jgi:uncharacterized protein (DUF1015 family)
MLDALPAAERVGVLTAELGPLRTATNDAYTQGEEAFYVYRLRRDGDEHVGVVGEVSLAAFLDGHVRGHEAVQPQRVEGLVEHFSSAVVRSELVALLHRPGPAVVAAVDRAREREPVLTFSGPDGWEQTVWQVPDELATGLSEELGDRVHYIADGHHRVAASLAVWENSGRPRDAGVMCVMYPLDGLSVMAFHRRVTGPVHAGELLGLLAESFDVREVAEAEEAVGCSGVYVDHRWYDVTCTRERPPGASGLDVAILDDHVLAPLLGSHPHTSPRLEIHSALGGVDELVRACDEDAGALFTLRPPSLDQLTEVADRGEVMPPKTTYFDPKPYAGIFLR